MSPVLKRLNLTTVVGRHLGDGDHEVTMTTGSVDRQNDEVVPEGGDFTDFVKNPVLQFAHDAWSLPVGSVTSLTRAADAWKARFRFLQGDEFAARVENAWKQRVLNAVSIGFLPLTWEHNDHGGLRFLKWQMLELSIVPVPANAEAVRMLKALHLDTRPPLAKSHRDDEHILHLDDEEEIDIESMPPYRKSDGDVDISCLDADELRSLLEAEVKRGYSTAIKEALAEATGTVPTRRIR
jgi:HK97 family phage prohead protease